MTSKQLRVTSDLFNSPLYKMSVGFDRLFNDMLDNPTFATTSGYPPYNVARITDTDDETKYAVTLAVAGFRESDIDITVEKNQLIVEGKSGAVEEEQAGDTVEINGYTLTVKDVSKNRITTLTVEKKT